MQKIVTSLWFGDNAEEAVEFYCSLFEDSKVLAVQRHTEAGPGAPGTVMVVDFELNGQRFIAINGGSAMQYTYAMSLLVNCANQEEVDRLWAALTADGGREDQCGWLFDKYGVPWQIWPTECTELLMSPDQAAATRATKAMFGMQKISIEGMREAFRGA
ncbi:MULTISPECIES: VOC family protein [unclassified Nocardia]|uniref:VOC family protein n=1 Tax=unclassified Nocardia TaxID=2637762 RepID=UPI001CE44A59|nr:MULTISPECIES: VOC family protein [unclassified Nocardia]